MPSGVFKPYAGVSTAVLVFTKTGARRHGSGVVLRHEGRRLLAWTTSAPKSQENDIPDIVEPGSINREEEAGRARAPSSPFWCPRQEIADNGYDLSINKYKKVEYVPVEYPSTTEILADLHELEMEITAGPGRNWRGCCDGEVRRNLCDKYGTVSGFFQYITKMVDGLPFFQGNADFGETSSYSSVCGAHAANQNRTR